MYMYEIIKLFNGSVVSNIFVGVINNNHHHIITTLKINDIILEQKITVFVV